MGSQEYEDGPEEEESAQEYIDRMYEEGNIREMDRADFIEMITSPTMTEKEKEEYADHYFRGMDVLERIDPDNVLSVLATIDGEKTDPIKYLIKFYSAAHGVETSQLFHLLANADVLSQSEEQEERELARHHRQTALQFFFASNHQRVTTLIAASFYLGFLAGRDIAELDAGADIFKDFVNSFDTGDNDE